MNTFETTATVEDHGHLHLCGVPFAPGTKVEVRISPTAQSAAEATTTDETLAAARDEMRKLFRSIKGFRNSPRIPREELYERGRVP
jgi:hypothetical protein